MTRLHNQVATLMQGIASVARERVSAVRAIKAATASALQSYDQERNAMANALRAGLEADRLSRSAEVLEIRDNANHMSQEFRQGHAHMGAALRQSLLESRASVVNAVQSLCMEFTEERLQFAKAHEKMARAQGKALAKDRQDRSGAVAAMMQSFNTAHRQMASTQRGSLTQARHQRSHALLELMRSFHPARTGQRRPHAARAWPLIAPGTAVLAADAAPEPEQLLQPEVLEGTRHFKPLQGKGKRK